MPKAKVPKRARTTKARASTTEPRARTTRPRRHISSFEKLPCELRQQIYFYLGFPIAGRCLHTCDDSCMPMAYRKIGYKNQRGEMRVTKCLSKTKVTRMESDEDPEVLLKHSPTCFHQVKPLRGIQSSSGNDEVGVSTVTCCHWDLTDSVARSTISMTP